MENIDNYYDWIAVKAAGTEFCATDALGNWASRDQNGIVQQNANMRLDCLGNLSWLCILHRAKS